MDNNTFLIFSNFYLFDFNNIKKILISEEL